MRQVTHVAWLSAVTVVIAATAQGADRADRRPGSPVGKNLAIIAAGSTASETEQRAAFYALRDRLRYYGLDGVRAEEAVRILSKVVLEDNRDDLRQAAAEALATVKHESAIETLTRALRDPWVGVRQSACDGLRQLGPKAESAAPELRQLIDRDLKLQTNSAARHATSALVAVDPKRAGDTLLLLAADPRASVKLRHEIARGFRDLADPRGAAFMERQLWDREVTDLTVRVVAALYFAKSDDDTSLRIMRRVLSEGVPPDNRLGRTAPTLVAVRDVQVVRGIAAEYLGRRRDKESFDTVARLAATEQGILLQTSLAKALGDYADPRGVAALAVLGTRTDQGFGSAGHRDGELHKAVVASLGKIGDDAALKAIYEGLAGSKTLSRPASDFWRQTKVDEHLAKFLAFYEAKPIDAKVAGIAVFWMLQNRKEKLRLGGAEAEAAKQDFLAHVDDKEHFGNGVDLTRDGEYKLTTDFAFYRNGLATVSFSFSDPNPKGPYHRHGSAHTVLYRKSAGQWVPMARVLEVVE